MPCAMISWTWTATSTYTRYLDMSIPGPSSLTTLFSHVCVWFWEVRGFFLGGCVNCRQLMEAGEKTRRCCWRSMIRSGWNSVTFSLLMYVSLLCLSLEMYQVWRPSFLCFCLGLFLSLFFFSSLLKPHSSTCGLFIMPSHHGISFQGLTDWLTPQPPWNRQVYAWQIRCKLLHLRIRQLRLSWVQGKPTSSLLLQLLF
jgi:hypothetical protein